MANVALLWNKPSDAGTYSGGSWVGGLPLTNLAEPDVKRVARSANAAIGSTQFRVDLGATAPAMASDFVLLGHNLSINATIRIVVTSDASDASAGDRALDTGEMPAWVPTAVLGALPWGTFPWDGVDPSAYPSAPTFFHRAASVAVGRYVWCYITDTANAAGYVEAGRFMAGAGWSPKVNAAYGASIQWVDPGETKRTRGGRRIYTPRPRFRQFQMQFSHMSKDDAYGVAFEVDRQIGKGGNFFLAMDPAEEGQFRFRRSVYAALVDSQAIAQPHFNRWSWSITAEELI